MHVSTTIPDAINSYGTGAVGVAIANAAPAMSGADLLTYAGGIVLIARFIYDTVRFINYLRDRKKGVFSDN